jgi:cytoskeletal protein CcmA (bactofilin family)
MWFRSGTTKARAEASKRRSGKRAVPSILSPEVRIEGDLYSDGEVHILGTFSGNVSAPKITLGEEGTLNGVVETETALINGTLTGRLAAGKVHLGPAARVTADILYVAMEIEPGAVYEGYSRRVDRIEPPDDAVAKLPAPAPRRTTQTLASLEQLSKVEAKA